MWVHQILRTETRGTQWLIWVAVRFPLVTNLPEQQDNQRHFPSSWSYLRWPHHAILLVIGWIWLSWILAFTTHGDQLALQDEKYQTGQIFFSRPQRSNLRENLTAHMQKELSWLPCKAPSAQPFPRVCGSLIHPLLPWDKPILQPKP